ncbi:MAG TPA: N-acetyltransferase family protein, partial [Candidatus Obscuribacterales bacterium]
MEALIRSARTADADTLLAIYAPYIENTVISFEYEVPTLADYTERVADVLADYPWLVAECEGAVAGFAYASRHSARTAYQWSVDVSVYLHAQHHGKGLGKALYTRLFTILRELGHVNAYAGIALP